MLKIKARNVVRLGGAMFDYELEDGTLLHESEWNCYNYTIYKGDKEIVYQPIYAVEENENGGHDIIGFEKISR